jgi:hypothetical protein
MMAEFKVGHRVSIVRGSQPLDDGAHIGKVGTLECIVEPNSDPEIYLVSFENDSNGYWFYFDELEPADPPADDELARLRAENENMQQTIYQLVGELHWRSNSYHHELAISALRAAGVSDDDIRGYFDGNVIL